MSLTLPGELNRLIIQVARAHRAKAGVLLAELELHPGQEIIMMMLQEQDGLSQTQLAERLKVAPPTVTKMLQRMEATGLVERKASKQDSRVSLVYLSEKGKTLESRIQQIWQQLEEQTIQGLSQQEKDKLSILLDKVRNNLSDVLEDCGKD